MKVTIGKYWVHRLEQWDLECNPIICIHKKTKDKTERIFCLWIGGGKLHMVR